MTSLHLDGSPCPATTQTPAGGKAPAATPHQAAVEPATGEATPPAGPTTWRDLLANTLNTSSGVNATRPTDTPGTKSPDEGHPSPAKDGRTVPAPLLDTNHTTQ